MSTNVVTISKEMYQKKLMLHSINFFLLRKSNKLTFFRKECNELRVTFNLLSYFRCNGSATFTSYCYLKCNENVTSYYKM